jgi:hypothetical protein
MPNSNVQDNIDDLFAKTQATLETLIVWRYLYFVLIWLTW